jgi:uracil phosphoribosyltransferase
MPIEDRDAAGVIDHALARHTLSRLRDAETGQVAFRKGLVKLGRLCGYEIADALFERRETPVETPLAETTGTTLPGLDDVVIVTVLRAATPFVEGLLKAFPAARQGVVSAGRDETAGRDPDGRFPITVEYVKLPAVEPTDTVIVADPMLATGSTICAVLDRVGAAGDPDRLLALSAVAAPEGIERVAGAAPAARPLTVAVDDRLDEDGFIVPGLGDAGDRAFGTTST